MEYKRALKGILIWNRRLFPILVVILLLFVILKSLDIGLPYRIANLDYKVWFVIVSGVLVIIDYYIKKSW